MARAGKPKPGGKLVTVYGKITRKLTEQLDRLAEERRWSRAQMVAYCIEQFVKGQAREETFSIH
jgi:predicted transcriptional regulator